MTSTLVMGPMYSQKTSESIAWILKNKLRSDEDYIYLKVNYNLRNGDIKKQDIRGHDNLSYQIPNMFLISRQIDLISACENKKYIVIDEIQFFNKDSFITVLKQLIKDHREVFLTGLDLDYKGEVFETTAYTACLVDKVIKKTSICVYCKSEATMTMKLAGSGQRFEEDGEASYVATCRNCHTSFVNDNKIGKTVKVLKT